MKQSEQIWVLGDLYTFHLSSPELSIIEVPAKAEQGPPLHSHITEDESFYVLEGELEVIHGSDMRTATAGDFIHFAKGTLHTFRNTAESGSRLLVILRPGSLADLFRMIGITNEHEAKNPALLRRSQEKLLALSGAYGLHIALPVGVDS